MVVESGDVLVYHGQLLILLSKVHLHAPHRPAYLLQDVATRKEIREKLASLVAEDKIENNNFVIIPNDTDFNTMQDPITYLGNVESELLNPFIDRVSNLCEIKTFDIVTNDEAFTPLSLLDAASLSANRGAFK